MAGDEDREKVEESTEPEQSNAAEEADTKGEEEDTGANIAPIVKLEAVSVSTGEEHENALFDIKAKLYRFDKDGSQWKERGVGQVKLLEHKESKKIRLLMRQQRTLKICANHAVLPGTVLQEHAGSDKTWVWHANDFADGDLKEELFTMRFGSVESAQKFKSAFEEAQDKMAALLGTVSEEEKEAADLVADDLAELKIPSEVEKASEEKVAGEEKANVEGKSGEEKAGASE